MILLALSLLTNLSLTAVWLSQGSVLANAKQKLELAEQELAASEEVYQKEKMTEEESKKVSFRSEVAFLTDDGTNIFHAYGCEALEGKLDNEELYTVCANATARAKGYSPCLKCHQ